jgi:hypothetical protein
MAKLASVLWMDVTWYRPDPTQGASATFQRDFELGGDAGLVLFFFSDTAMTGGTGHVVECAMSKDTPVYAWGFDEEKGFVRIGEYDPNGMWTSIPL